MNTESKTKSQQKKKCKSKIKNDENSHCQVSSLLLKYPNLYIGILKEPHYLAIFASHLSQFGIEIFTPNPN